jgi:hypothetical protein
MTRYRGLGNRGLGAIAGLGPGLAILLLFVVSGSFAPAGEVAISLALFAVLSITPGWLSGPFAVRRGWAAGACAYGLAWISVQAWLALVQAGFEAWSANGADVVAITSAVVGRAAYALISAVYFLIPAVVLGAVWVAALRALTHLWSGGGRTDRLVDTEEDQGAKRPGRDPIRLGIGAAAIIAGYALVVAAISAGAHEPDELGPPEAVPRPLLLAVLFMLPAAIAVVGAIRRSGPVLIAAGVVCLIQAFVAFSGVTIPFAVPALLLLALGAEQQDRVPMRTVITGVLVVLLGLGAWVAALAMTETSCWVAHTAPDGTVVYAAIPIPAGADLGSSSGSLELDLESGDLGKGCGGGQLTFQGAGVAAVLGVGAIAVATLGSMELSPRKRPIDAPA